MLFKRQVTVRMEKEKKTFTEPKEPFIDQMQFEKKTDHVLSRLENIGVKIFLGVCVYVILDTVRQVQVAKASNPNS